MSNQMPASAAPVHDRLLELIDRFSAARIVVLGDLLADEFVYGRVARVSREAPVLILEYDSTEIVPGGAGNAANNAAALGGRHHFCIARRTSQATVTRTREAEGSGHVRSDAGRIRGGPGYSEGGGSWVINAVMSATKSAWRQRRSSGAQRPPHISSDTRVESPAVGR